MPGWWGWRTADLVPYAQQLLVSPTACGNEAQYCQRHADVAFTAGASIFVRAKACGDGDVASELVVSASQVAINAMGCTADVASLNFAMGDINMTQFDSNRRVGGVTQTMNLA